MKKTLPLSLIVAAGFMLFQLWPAAAQQFDEDAPEFYFTRVMYNGGGRRSFGRLSDVPRFDCANLPPGGGFGGGGSWATDYPASDCKFMWGVQRLTGIRVHPNPNVVRIMDETLFQYPYLYLLEPGRGMTFSDEEASRLREYFDRGGFLHVDDFWGPDQAADFEYEISKVFPDRSLEELPLSHEVFRTFFEVDTVMQIPNISNGRRITRNGGQGPTWQDSRDTQPRIYGISDDNGRLMVVITYNSDLGDAWEWMDDPEYPEKFSGQAYRMGINFIVYAMSH
jgi:hypothetical protein